MNENNKKELCTFLASNILGKMCFNGRKCTEDSPEFKMIQELKDLIWEVKDECYIVEIQNSKTFTTTTHNFLDTSHQFNGYQIKVFPLTKKELEFILSVNFPILNPKIFCQTENLTFQISFDKSQVDCFFLNPNSIELATDLLLTSLLGRFRALRLTFSEIFDLTITPFSYYVALHYFIQSNICLLNIMASETPNTRNEKLRPVIINWLKNQDSAKHRKIDQNQISRLYVEYAESCSSLREKLTLFEVLKEIYPHHSSINSRYSALSNRKKKIDIANNLVEEKKYTEALSAFEELLNTLQDESDQEQVDFHEKIIYTHLKLKQCDIALQICEKIKEKFPCEIRSACAKGKIFKTFGSYKKAILYYEGAILLIRLLKDPPFCKQEYTDFYYIASYYGKGSCFFHLKDYENAIADYLKATKKLKKVELSRFIVPYKMLKILYLQICLEGNCDEKIFFEFSKKIEKLDIVNDVIEVIYNNAENLLFKTFHLFQERINQFLLNTKLIEFFLSQKDINKLMILGDALLKNKIVFSEAALNLINVLITVDITILQDSDTKKIGNFCKIVLENPFLNEVLYKNALFFLYKHFPLNQAIQALKNIIHSQFDLYLKIIKPNSAQLHYELAQFLEPTYSEESLLSYQKVLELDFEHTKNKKKNFEKLKTSALRMLALSFVQNKTRAQLNELALEKIFQLAHENQALCQEIKILLEENSHCTLYTETHQKFLKPQDIPPQEIPLQENKPLSKSVALTESIELISLAELILSNHNTSNKLYISFLEQLQNNQDKQKELIFYVNLLNHFKYKKQFSRKKEILYKIANILTQNNSVNKKEKIVVLAIDISQDPIFSFNSIINDLLDLLLPELEPIFTLIEHLRKYTTSKISTAFMREAIERSEDEYQKWLNKFSTDHEILIILIKKLLKKDKFSAVFFILKQIFKTLSPESFLELRVLLNRADHILEHINPDEIYVFFQFISNILERNETHPLKELSENVLTKILSKIDKYSPLYREIFGTLYHNVTVELSPELFQVFKMLTDHFGEDYVYLTGSRVLSLITCKPFSSTDLDFIVICDEIQAKKNLCTVLGFTKKKDLPGISLYTKEIGNFSNKILLEVVHVKLNPNKTLTEQLRNNAETRDFTICALFLNIFGIVFDYFNGIEDAKNQQLRSIQPALDSFKKDSVRLLRAIKYLMNGYNWGDEVQMAVNQFPNKKLQPWEYQHLYKVIKKHLFNASPAQKEMYFELLRTQKLWKKLFNYSTRMQLREEFNLNIPYEYPKNNGFFTQNGFYQIEHFNPSFEQK